MAEGTVSHFARGYRLGAAFAFNFIGFINNRALEETQETFNLNALEYDITLTPDSKIRFLNSIKKLRNQNEQPAIIGMIAGLGEKPTEEELEKARAITPYYRGGLPMKRAAQP